MVTQNTQENNENNIVVFGRTKEAAEQPKDNVVDKSKETTDESVKKEEANVEQKETNVQKTEAKTEVTDKSTVIENESEKGSEDTKPSFKVIPKGEEKTETKQEDKETETLSEDKVKSFLKSKYGIDVSDFNEFSKKEKLSDPVAEFKKFNEQTGRGINAYYNSKRDWSKEDGDKTIREFYKYQNPNASEEDINTELELIKLTDDEKDELSPREVKEVEAKYRRKKSEAVEFMNKIAKDYSLPMDNGKPSPKKELTAEQITEMYAPHRKNVNASLEKFNEFSVSIDGLGELKSPITQEHKDLIYRRTQTEQDYFGAWTKEDGTFDTDKSSQDVAWSIPEIRNSMLSDYASQIYTILKEKDSKTQRNVTLDSKTPKQQQDKKGSMSTFGKKQSNTMGQPLF